MRLRSVAAIIIVISLLLMFGFQNCSGSMGGPASSEDNSKKGGTTVGNPKVSVDIRLSGHDVTTVTNTRICVKELKFESIDLESDSMVILPAIDLGGRVQDVASNGSSLVKAELEPTVISGVELSLDGECLSGKNIAFQNTSGERSASDEIKLTFDGQLEITQETKQIVLDVEPLMIALATVTADNQIKGAVEGTQPDFKDRDMMAPAPAGSPPVPPQAVGCPTVTVPSFRSSASEMAARCDEQFAMMLAYMPTFNPGLGKNGLPNCGQTTRSLGDVEGRNIDLTANSVGELDGNGLVSASQVDEVRGDFLIRANRIVHILRTTRAVADTIGEVEGSGHLLYATSIESIDGFGCYAANEIRKVTSNGYYTSRGTAKGTIEELDMRKDKGASFVDVKNMTIKKVLACSDQTDFEVMARMRLVNSNVERIDRTQSCK